MSKYFVVRQSDDTIVNIVMWDGVSGWKPDEGQYLEPFQTGVGIGYGKVNGEWVDLRVPEIEETTETEV